MQLHRLDDCLRKLGYGTAFVDPDDALPDRWNGLLVWEIADGAHTGITIHSDDDLAAVRRALAGLNDRRPRPV